MQTAKIYLVHVTDIMLNLCNVKFQLNVTLYIYTQGSEIRLYVCTARVFVILFKDLFFMLFI